MTLTSSAKEWKMWATNFDYEMLLKKLIRERIGPREKVHVDLSHYTEILNQSERYLSTI